MTGLIQDSRVQGSQDDKSSLAALALGALGVVYGDIGTSPLYAFRVSLETFNADVGIAAPVLGILSLIFWTIFLVVSVKYASFVMRADNRGEGGSLALLALSLRPKSISPGKRKFLVAITLIAASLFFGDGIITPAISVLSAVEGVEIAAPVLHPYVIPISLLVLILLFRMQRRGTSTIGRFFGPVMVLWFLVLAVSGVWQIISVPKVLAAVNPIYGIRLFADHPLGSFLTLGGVVLAVTGAEVLYADMGHFGKRPIRLTWFYFVLPALLLNYFGQGALLLKSLEAIQNPFFLMYPDRARLTILVLSTAATSNASQAVISGAYSIARQALQLGYLPRTEVRHTSAYERGQIYLPVINWTLLVGVVWLVLAFKSSGNLASAYGIAVTGEMLMTSLLMYFVMRHVWKWNAIRTVPLIGMFLLVDLSLFSANLPKIHAGGWFPLLIGALVFTVMSTWRRGRSLIYRKMQPIRLTMEEFLKSLNVSEIPRAGGTAVFLAAPGENVPHALLHNLKHNQVIHERVIIFTVIVDDTPRTEDADRFEFKDYGNNFCQIIAHVGYMEFIDVPRLLAANPAIDPPCDMMETSFFLSRIRVISSEEPGMAGWRERLFAAMVRNAANVTDYFQIPPNRVVEFDLRVNI
jgi:KUP system potassium uptake protein